MTTVDNTYFIRSTRMRKRLQSTEDHWELI